MHGHGDLVAFLAVSAAVVTTPGQDTALTIRNTLRWGRGGGVGTAAGVVSGQGIWAAAAGVGVVNLLAHAHPAFEALRIAGAAYLLYLGTRTLVTAVHAAHEPPAALRRPGRAYRQGLLSNLSNPKIALFFTALLPQFASTTAGALALAALFMLMTLCWLTGYAFVVGRASGWFSRRRVRRAMDAMTGGVLIGIGAHLVSDAVTG